MVGHRRGAAPGPLSAFEPANSRASEPGPIASRTAARRVVSRMPQGARIFKDRPHGLFPSRLVPRTGERLPGARPTGVPGSRLPWEHTSPGVTRFRLQQPPGGHSPRSPGCTGGAQRLRARPQRLRQVPVRRPSSGLRARASDTRRPPCQARLGPWGGAAS
ncbi:hypothetical protein NDU88_002538 [Pleurodeles waltl]|uniref:Uncharacterized protein n=1 Tax=Pleurodeles waltl TaxID=8319 RepID=A0AAV7M2S1_PLEWA|nr:hypothetical protein NDU88_002538 [Pleurodeles waltl]